MPNSISDYRTRKEVERALRLASLDAVVRVARTRFAAGPTPRSVLEYAAARTVVTALNVLAGNVTAGWTKPPKRSTETNLGGAS